MKTPESSRSKKSSAAVADLFADSPLADTPAVIKIDLAPDALPDDAATIAPAEAGPASFGECLRRAREDRGLELASCAQSLHLSTRVLAKLEADDYSGIDSHVYLRSYLSKYAAWLGVSRDAVDAHVAQLPPPSETLVSTGGITRSRYLLERYATAATYVVLTAVIVVPIVWIGLKGGLDREVARLAPLDAAPVATPSRSEPAAMARLGARGKDADAAGTEQPLQASLAPFSALDKGDAAATANPPPAVDTAGKHVLTLVLPEASWVEITGSKGQRLEYGLLPAGTHKTWHSADPLDVSIGNADGASVTIDGDAVDLTRFRHAKVARFHVRVAHGKALPESM